MMNSSVRPRSLPDRPRRGGRAGAASVEAGSLAMGLGSIMPAPSSEATQQVNDASQRRPRQTRRKIADGGAFSGFRQSRIGHNELADRADVQPLLDGERPRRDQLAGMGPDDGDPENVTAPGGDHLHVATRLALGL